MPAMLRNGLLAAGMAGVILVVGAVAHTDGPTYAERLKLILEPIEPCRLVDTFEPFTLMHEQPCGREDDETNTGGGDRLFADGGGGGVRGANA